MACPSDCVVTGRTLWDFLLETFASGPLLIIMVLSGVIFILMVAVVYLMVTRPRERIEGAWRRTLKGPLGLEHTIEYDVAEVAEGVKSGLEAARAGDGGTYTPESVARLTAEWAVGEAQREFNEFIERGHSILREVDECVSGIVLSNAYETLMGRREHAPVDAALERLEEVSIGLQKIIVEASTRAVYLAGAPVAVGRAAEANQDFTTADIDREMGTMLDTWRVRRKGMTRRVSAPF